MPGRAVLLVMEYSMGIKHFYRRHHYVLHNVLIVKAFCMMEHSSPFIKIQPQEWTHDHCVRKYTNTIY